VSRSDLETALGVRLDRYEPARAGALHYAQIDVIAGNSDAFAEDDFWAGIIDCMERIGPQIQALGKDRSIGRTSVDLAVSFRDGLALATYNLPSHVAEAVGRRGIDIEFSVYLGSDDEKP
jgi:hypothetical protein